MLQVVGVAIATIIGQYVPTIVSLDILICAVFYTFILFKRFNSPAKSTTTVVMTKRLCGDSAPKRPQHMNSYASSS